MAESRTHGLDDVLPPGDQVHLETQRQATAPFQSIGAQGWLDPATRPPRLPTLLSVADEKGQRIPFLPLGKVAMLASPGGVGKTQVLLQLAVSVARCSGRCCSTPRAPPTSGPGCSGRARPWSASPGRRCRPHRCSLRPCSTSCCASCASTARRSCSASCGRTRPRFPPGTSPRICTTSLTTCSPAAPLRLVAVRECESSRENGPTRHAGDGVLRPG
ncbi:MAG: hypothetical protein EXR79_08735 [Myxococcales bacterium]|nr:hypothetical protein [Myxococcales bacterium]